MVHLIGLLRSSGAAGADGPNRLIGDDYAGKLLFGYATEGDFCLHANDFKRDTLLALLERFTHAEDYCEACVQCGTHALLDGRIRLTKIGAALAVADHNIL